MSPGPSIVVLGGPNGAGKTTAAPRLLRGVLRVDEFVNADTLAAGLSAFRPESAAIPDPGRHGSWTKPPKGIPPCHLAEDRGGLR